MSDSQFEREVLQRLLFDLLLVTDGRTTDILETLLNEKVRVEVIRQEQIANEDINLLGESSGGPYYIRESILVGEKSGLVVSHNIALVYSKHVPKALYESLTHRQEGIGKAINSLGVRTFRKVLDSGFMNRTDTIDLFQRPVTINFANSDQQLPYKRYYIYFGRSPGIQMLEYYHPNLISHRLEQELKKE
ncbi:chorismate pyruvate-lyase family protein [Gracilibacillus massiliensis]|uniref:chorismate pyruvate-lyase family protein n=1 Tax=Gracilibacillus massiliensis TaxID=1564956 RepID=UPI00071CCF8B|nr:chorismate pyruvate-lyase family protein [Gracilibacillus massiliensis]